MRRENVVCIEPDSSPDLNHVDYELGPAKANLWSMEFDIADQLKYMVREYQQKRKVNSHAMEIYTMVEV